MGTGIILQGAEVVVDQDSTEAGRMDSSTIRIWRRSDLSIRAHSILLPSLSNLPVILPTRPTLPNGSRHNSPLSIRNRNRKPALESQQEREEEEWE